MLVRAATHNSLCFSVVPHYSSHLVQGKNAHDSLHGPLSRAARNGGYSGSSASESPDPL